MEDMRPVDTKNGCTHSSRLELYYTVESAGLYTFQHSLEQWPVQSGTTVVPC